MGEISSRNNGKNPLQHNLTLCNVKFQEKTPGNSNGGKLLGRIPVRMKMGEIPRF